MKGCRSSRVITRCRRREERKLLSDLRAQCYSKLMKFDTIYFVLSLAASHILEICYLVPVAPSDHDRKFLSAWRSSPISAISAFTKYTPDSCSHFRIQVYSLSRLLPLTVRDFDVTPWRCLIHPCSLFGICARFKLFHLTFIVSLSLCLHPSCFPFTIPSSCFYWRSVPSLFPLSSHSFSDLTEIFCNIKMSMFETPSMPRHILSTAFFVTNF